MMSEEVKPCPFCGNKDISMSLNYGAAMVSCDKCECLGFVFTGLKGIYLDEVMEQWNTRPREAELEEEIRRLRVLGDFSAEVDSGVGEAWSESDNS